MNRRHLVILSALALTFACGGAGTPVEALPPTPAIPDVAPARKPEAPPAAPTPEAQPAAPSPPTAPAEPAPPRAPAAKKKAPPPWSSIRTTCVTDQDCAISCEGSCCGEACGCTMAVNKASLQAWRDAGGVRDCEGVICPTVGCDYQPANGATCSNGTCRPTMGLTIVY